MTKPLKEITFRLIGGTWQDVAGESGTLAETLERLGIIIDDKCEFARIRDYQNMISIWYSTNARKIVITLWKINTQ